MLMCKINQINILREIPNVTYKTLYIVCKYYIWYNIRAGWEKPVITFANLRYHWHALSSIYITISLITYLAFSNLCIDLLQILCECSLDWPLPICSNWGAVLYFQWNFMKLLRILKRSFLKSLSRNHSYFPRGHCF